MKTDLTEIAYILDRSGSMSPLTEAAIDGFNTFLGDQLSAPGEARLTLALFDDEYEIPCDRLPLPHAPDLTAATYQPRGTTALLDAIGRTIDDLGAKLDSLPERERPGHVIIAIFTDGLENASTRYSLADINQRITHQRKKYGWEFLFLGANQDAIATAASMGIGAESAVTYEHSAKGTRRTSKAVSETILDARMKLHLGQPLHEKKQTLRDRYQSDND
jgi:hypothetical protein